MLALYGLNLLAHVVVYWWQRRTGRGLPAVARVTSLVDDAGLPQVTLQLPLYNERHVAARLVDAVAGLDWPADRLHIQVLDDSTDDTTAALAAALARHAARWLACRARAPSEPDGVQGRRAAARAGSQLGRIRCHLRRRLHPPAGLPAADDPELHRSVGRVRPGALGPLNAEASGFTQAQALGFDGHFIVEKQARHGAGAFIHFNGSAGVWRRAAIDAAGGWQADTLTEDLDLSYRAQLAGWRIVYRGDVAALAELPVQVDAFKRQQYRWAKGSMQTSVKLLGALWRAPSRSGAK